MKVDFKLKRAPGYNVASVTEEADYSDKAIRASFTRVAQWAAQKKLTTGRWLFIELVEEGDRIKWNACIEVKGKAKGSQGVRIKKLKASDVVSVTFNPDEVSARVVYHAINDWVRWRKKDKTISRVGGFREVYPGDPWKNADSWQNMEVQLLVTKRAKK